VRAPRRNRSASGTHHHWRRPRPPTHRETNTSSRSAMLHKGRHEEPLRPAERGARVPALPTCAQAYCKKGDRRSRYGRPDANAPLSNFLSLTRLVESFPSGTMSTSVNTKVSLNMTPAMVTSGNEAARACGRRKRQAPIATVDGRRKSPPPGARRAHRSDPKCRPC